MTEPFAENIKQLILWPLLDPINTSLRLSLTFELCETPVAAAVRALEEVEVPPGLGVGGAALNVVGGEALPQRVHVLRLALLWCAHIALETRH